MFVFDYYVDAVSINKLEASQTARIGSLTIFTAGLVLSFIWSHPFIDAITNLSTYKDIATEDHLLSGGVVFSLVLILFGQYDTLISYV